VPPLHFLQPAYLCSSANVVIQAVPCDASAMSWARAPYIYKAYPFDDFSKPAILCLSGRTMVWCERLQPGESRDFALGNVIAASANVAAKLRPTSQCHPDDHKAAIFEERSARVDETQSASKEAVGKRAIRARFREFAAASKILFESIGAREGFLVCELTNHSAKPAYVFIQLNKGVFYGGSGLVGFAIRIISTFFRLSHVSMSC